MGVAVGAIPLSEIRDQGKSYGISDPDDLADFIFIIQAMDAAFLKEETERAKRERDNANRRVGRPR